MSFRPYLPPISFETLHPPDLCFYCKRKPVCEAEEVELYRTVQNTVGLLGYVARHATTTIEIPICKSCARSHRNSKRRANVLWWATYSTTAIWITWQIHGEGNGWLFSGVCGLALGGPVGGFAWLLLLAIWVPCSFLWCAFAYFLGQRLEPPDSEKNFPLYKALVTRGWQGSKPSPKSDESYYSGASSECVAELHRYFIADAIAVIKEYEVAVKSHFTR